MAVDAQVQSFLNQLNAASVPPVERQTPDQARETFLSTIATLGEPEPVHATEDRAITGHGGHKIPVRIYLPREADGLHHRGVEVPCDLEGALRQDGRAAERGPRHRGRGREAPGAVLQDAHADSEVFGRLRCPDLTVPQGEGLA